MVRRKDLTTSEKTAIIQFLLPNSKEGRPLRGKISEAALKFGCCKKTVSRAWAAAVKQSEEGQVMQIISAKKGNAGRPRMTIDLPLIQNLSVLKRSTIRRLAQGIAVSKSTVSRWLKRGLIRAHTNSIKPALTVDNKFLRLRFSLEALEFDRILQRLKFKSMHNTIHIDEKWFYMSRASHRMYLTPNEIEPHRSCKSKKFMEKVMFMCAVSRPVFGDNGEVLFDGKIGIFPFTRKVAAKRKSKNRPAGTLETKPIESITKDVTKECLITQILPAIRRKWPPLASKLIFIQQDNAKPHIKDSDIEFRAAASEKGFDIRLVHQPPNSPDTNVNDLGWFRAIQSIQIESNCTNIDQLVAAVSNSFEELTPHTLNKVFLSLQGCMVEIIKVRGHNSYKVPHLKKDALARVDNLSTDLEVDVNLVRECFTYMLENGLIEETGQLQARLGI